MARDGLSKSFRWLEICQEKVTEPWHISNLRWLRWLRWLGWLRWLPPFALFLVQDTPKFHFKDKSLEELNDHKNIKKFLKSRRQIQKITEFSGYINAKTIELEVNFCVCNWHFFVTTISLNKTSLSLSPSQELNTSDLIAKLSLNSTQLQLQLWGWDSFIFR